MLLAIIGKQITMVCVALALLQFPFYGYFWARKADPPARRKLAFWIAGIHVATAFAAWGLDVGTEMPSR